MSFLLLALCLIFLVVIKQNAVSAQLSRENIESVDCSTLSGWTLSHYDGSIELMTHDTAGDEDHDVRTTCIEIDGGTSNRWMEYEFDATGYWDIAFKMQTGWDDMEDGDDFIHMQ